MKNKNQLFMYVWKHLEIHRVTAKYVRFKEYQKMVVFRGVTRSIFEVF